MSVYKIVVRAFVFVGKAGKTGGLSQSREFFITAGKKFMGIALMAYIKNNGVLRALENAVKCNSKFNNAEIACKVAAVFSNGIDDSCTDFLGQLFKFFLRKLFYVVRRMDF